MTLPIADLHCDLLSFLAQDPSHTVDNPKSNASYPQMQAGGVVFQALAIFTESTKDSYQIAQKQLDLLRQLLLTEKYQLFSSSSSSIQVLPAFENASGFCSDTMSLEEGFACLESILQQFSKILYIGLTWDGENRFGGGSGTTLGLKEDGKVLLEWLHKKNIAVDMSHTSDFLADDILNHIAKKSLDLPIIASHSNVRKVTNQKRNLPDWLAKEIISKKGLIGLNFFAPFVGKEPTIILSHVRSILEIGGEDSLCFGADFFPTLFSSYIQNKYHTDVCFFPDMPNSSSYPYVLSLLRNQFSEEVLEKISHKNVFSFLK